MPHKEQLEYELRVANERIKELENELQFLVSEYKAFREQSLRNKHVADYIIHRVNVLLNKESSNV